MIRSSCIQTGKKWSIWKPRAYVIKKPSNNLAKDKMQPENEEHGSAFTAKSAPNWTSKMKRKCAELKQWTWKRQLGNGKIQQRVYFINFAFITFTHTHNCYLWQNDSYVACILKRNQLTHWFGCFCSGHTKWNRGNRNRTEREQRNRVGSSEWLWSPSVQVFQADKYHSHFVEECGTMISHHHGIWTAFR